MTIGSNNASSDQFLLYRVIISPGGPLRDLNQHGEYVDEDFTVSDAYDYLDACALVDPTYKAECHGDFNPYLSSNVWSEHQRKALERENEHRKKLASKWEVTRESIWSRVSAIAGLTVSMNGTVEVPEKFFRPLVAFLAAPMNAKDDLLDVIHRICVCNGSEHAIMSSAQEPGAESFFNPINLEMWGSPLQIAGSMPLAGEATAEFAARIATTTDRLSDIRRAHERSQNIPALFAAMLRNSAPHKPVEFAISGLLPRAAVSLLVGPPKIGKSTLVLQAVADVGTENEFLGLKTNLKDGELAVFLTGEDDYDAVGMRLTAMSGGIHDDRVLILDYQAVAEALATLENAKVAILAIDTAAAYASAGVNDGASARELMGLLRNFAQRKNCAVILIHHTNKGTNPRNPKATIEAMKGSGEFVSAARNILSFHAEGDKRVLTIVKHNMPSAVPMNVVPLRLQYDPATERHIPDHSENEVRASAIPDAGPSQAKELGSDAATVASVIRGLIAAGRPVAQSGKNEPFYAGAAEIKGWPRSRVRSAHAAAIAGGMLTEKGVP